MSGTLTVDQTTVPTSRNLFTRWRSRPVFVLFVLTMAAILGARIFGASDLYDKDQSKTIGFVTIPDR